MSVFGSLLFGVLSMTIIFTSVLTTVWVGWVGFKLFALGRADSAEHGNDPSFFRGLGRK